MVNKDNINRLIDHLRLLEDDQFNMGEWITTKHATDIGFRAMYSSILYRPEIYGKKMKEENLCGTVACIAGHIIAMELITEPFNVTNVTPYNYGMWYLCLTYQQAADLFMMESYSTDDRQAVELSDAIAALEHLRDTGEVSWEAFDKRRQIESDREFWANQTSDA